VTPRPAHVRYYFDADVLGLAKHVASERVVLHKRVRPPCRIRPSTKDPIWIPQVTVKGWLIVTRDSRFRSTERRSTPYAIMVLGWLHSTAVTLSELGIS